MYSCIIEQLCHIERALSPSAVKMYGTFVASLQMPVELYYPARPEKLNLDRGLWEALYCANSLFEQPTKAALRTPKAASWADQVPADSL